MSIEICNITKTYENKIVLQDYSTTIETGTITCFMGKSGCGKTTLLRLLMGIEHPDSGEIKGLESNLSSAVFQEDRLLENLSVYQNLLLVCKKKPEEFILNQLLEKIGLHNCKSQPIAKLSGGMKRRVALARALMAEYDVLFLDEPFKGLDVDTKAKVIQVVKEYTRGKTVIMVTHEEDEIMQIGGILQVLRQS